jgi:hypothetical protein
MAGRGALVALQLKNFVLDAEFLTAGIDRPDFARILLINNDKSRKERAFGGSPASYLVRLLFNELMSAVNASYRRTATLCDQICDRPRPARRHRQPHRRAAARPVSRFREFAQTAAPEGWECGATRRWRVADAAAAAATVAHALGEFSVMAESAAAELRALAWWLSVNEAEWVALSRRAILLAGKLDQQPAAAGFDNAFGVDRGAVALTDAEVVRRLNSWCRAVLGAFYADAVRAREDPAQAMLRAPLVPETPHAHETPHEAEGIAAEAQPPETTPEPKIPPAPEGTGEAIWLLYIAHAAKVQAELGHPPRRNHEDDQWRKRNSVGVPELRALRRV